MNSDTITHTEPDRVRRYTSAEQLRTIDRQTERNLAYYRSQPPEAIDERIAELQREWSIERYLQINVVVVGLATTALALTSDRRWGLLTCAGLGFFLFHALRGFDPPLPALRRLGIRTRAEINREIYALKILRGDFQKVNGKPDLPEPPEIAASLRAVGAGAG